MIHIAIVEDDPQVREQLAGYVRRYERQFGKMFELTTFEDGDEIVSDYKAVYDIILLDVQMHRMDGMAAAEAIRKVDRDVILIFITNMAQFAIRGYAVDALDYILKPVPYFAFSQQLQKAVDRLRRRQKVFLTVPIEGGLRRIDVAAIYYLESEGHYVRFYTEDGDVLTPGSHGSTFGGNPVCCAGALSILHRLDGPLLQSVQEKSDFIVKALTGAKGVRSVTGLGLMLGVETERPVKDVISECMARGVLVISAKNKVRLLPALNIPMAQLEQAVSVLKDVCAGE